MGALVPTSCLRWSWRNVVSHVQARLGICWCLLRRPNLPLTRSKTSSSHYVLIQKVKTTCNFLVAEMEVENSSMILGWEWQHLTGGSLILDGSHMIVPLNHRTLKITREPQIVPNIENVPSPEIDSIDIGIITYLSSWRRNKSHVHNWLSKTINAGTCNLTTRPLLKVMVSKLFYFHLSRSLFSTRSALVSIAPIISWSWKFSL